METNHEVVFQRHGEVTVEEAPIPKPGGEELLIKTDRSLISIGTELTILEGKGVPPGSVWEEYGKLPFRPGYNNIGTVVEVGSGLGRDWIGRRVATYGNHAAYVRANAKDARPVPAAVKDEEAAFFTLAEISLNGVRRAEVELGQTVVVFGVGLIGQLALRFCRMSGARRVVAVDCSDERLRWLPGDSHVVAVNSSGEELSAIVDRLTGGRMAEVAIEATGDAAFIPEELTVLKPQGRFVVLSSPSGKTLFDFHDLCNSPSYTIVGAHNRSHPAFETPEHQWTNQRDCELFFHMILDGDIDLAPLVSHRIGYAQAPQMYAALIQDRTKAMGVILEWP